MKLSTRLMLAMVALVLVTTAVLGFLNYRSIVQLLIPRTVARLQTHAQLNALLLDAQLRSTLADAKSAQASPALQDLLIRRPEVTGPNGPNWRQRIEDRFASELAAKPNCAILRIIGAQDDGLELVRVDRLGPDGAIRVVPPAALTRRGDRAYFKEGMALPRGEVAISRVELNRTATGLEAPYTPTVRTMAPIDAADGTRLGVLVINTNLNALFDRVRNSIDSGDTIYVINDAGDYLVHPDRSRNSASISASRAASRMTSRPLPSCWATRTRLRR